MHKAKKRFGQNFLTDTNLLKKIVEIARIDQKNVIEIGPGLGALTQFLVRQAQKYVAYEIDDSLEEALKPFMHDHVFILFKDFLKDDTKETLEKYFGDEDVHLVGNLPYNITSPIIFKFLATKQLKTATIMVQKEVGERMISKNNVKSYNAFSAILQYHTNVTKVMDVKRTLFKPQPKVDSMVIRLEKREQKLNERLENLYERIVKMSFAQKRKTLVNNLSHGLNLSKVILEKVIEDLKYPLNVRAESLTVKDFIELTKRIHKIIK